MLHVHNSVAHDFNEDVVEGAVFILGYHYIGRQQAKNLEGEVFVLKV